MVDCGYTSVKPKIYLVRPPPNPSLLFLLEICGNVIYEFDGRYVDANV